jgi:hypothetical protein
MDIKVAGVLLHLSPSSKGPVPYNEDPKLKELLAVLHRIVVAPDETNLPRHPKEKQLVEYINILENKGEIVIPGHWLVVRPDPYEVKFNEQAAERWYDLTDYHPGEDSYYVSVTWSRYGIIVPRQALLDIIYALKDLRQKGVAAAPKLALNEEKQFIHHLLAQLNLQQLPLRLHSSFVGITLTSENRAIFALVNLINWLFLYRSKEELLEFINVLESQSEIDSQRWWQDEIVRPTSEQMNSPAAQLWQQLTGSELGDDIYLINWHSEELIVPRRALLEIIYALRELRQKYPSPWEIWSLAQQEELKSQPDESGPGLFAEKTKHPYAFDGERHHLSDVEEIIDDLEFWLADEPKTATTEGKITAERLTLLIELELSGLLNNQYWQEKLSYLQKWELDKLEDYYKAALKLIAYANSSERQQAIPNAEPLPIRGGAISLDWFRQPLPLPSGLTDFEWLAMCEAGWLRLNPKPRTRFYLNYNHRRYIILLRNEDGRTIALYSYVSLATPV